MIEDTRQPIEQAECPECGGHLIVQGDKWEGHEECTECDYEFEWNNLP